MFGVEVQKFPYRGCFAKKNVHEFYFMAFFPELPLIGISIEFVLISWRGKWKKWENGGVGNGT